MRLLIRLVTWALAALGIKALYDRFWPKAQELRQPATEVLGSAKSAARDVAEHGKTAAGEVAAEAKSAAQEVAEHAKTAADQVAAEARSRFAEARPEAEDAAQKAMPTGDSGGVVGQ